MFLSFFFKESKMKVMQSNTYLYVGGIVADILAIDFFTCVMKNMIHMCSFKRLWFIKHEIWYEIMKLRCEHKYMSIVLILQNSQKINNTFIYFK